MSTFFKRKGKNVELRYKLPEQYTHLQEFCVLGSGKTQKEATVLRVDYKLPVKQNIKLLEGK